MSEEKELELLKANVRAAISSNAGKELVWHILSMCGIYNNQFSGNSTTFFLEGKRTVGLELIELLGDADPLFYPSLLLEKAKEEQNDG